MKKDINKYIKKLIYFLTNKKNEHGFLYKKRDIKKCLKDYKIENYTLIKDPKYGYVVDVDGEVNISSLLLKSIDVKFNAVSGNFYCYNNQLTSLRGSPNIVGRNFICDQNSINSLEYSPKVVGGDYSCSRNNLTNLKGCPSVINAYFCCSQNELTSLENGPVIVNGRFSAHDNKIENLIHFPQKITATVYLKNNHNLNEWQNENYFQILHQEHLRQKKLIKLKQGLEDNLVKNSIKLHKKKI